VVEVVIGTPICRRSSFVLDKFLANQKEIQQNYPSSELVFATEEKDYIRELEGLISSYGLRGNVLYFDVIKQDYATLRGWNVTCGREAIRQYFVSQADAKFILWLDGDMIYDPNIINIMLKEIQGFDVTYSGYRGIQETGYEMGTGCSLYTKNIMGKVKFRYLAFPNHREFPESFMMEADLIRLGSRIKKGVFVSVRHYVTEQEFYDTAPQSVGLLRKIADSRFIRYPLIKASIFFKHDFFQPLHNFFSGKLKAI